jgi:hypothetical protein
VAADPRTNRLVLRLGSAGLLLHHTALMKFSRVQALTDRLGV